MKKMSIFGVLTGAAILCAAPISLHQSQNKGLSLSLDSADARVGQPLSAGSVAGVHSAPTGGQCGTATKILRSRQCDRDEPRGGASATLMIARSALLQVKPRAFGNAECGVGA